MRDAKMSKEEIRHIAEDMIEELRECEDGYVTTSGRLARAYGYGEEELGFMGMFDLHEALFRAARANHITLDMSSHEGKVEGLPFNLDFVVHNKKARIKCPYCGCKNTARYVYGYPAFDEEMQQKLNAGKIKLGGCCITTVDVSGQAVQSMPARFCNDCKKDFGSPAIFLDRTTKEYESYMDEVVGLKFGVGGYFEGHSDIEIKRTEGGAHVRTVVFPYGEDCSIDRDITVGKWERIVNQLYNRMYLHEWKKKYVDPCVLDGEQWELKVTLTGGRERNYYGSNDYPPYWTELKAVFMPYLKNNKRL